MWDPLAPLEGQSKMGEKQTNYKETNKHGPVVWICKSSYLGSWGWRITSSGPTCAAEQVQGQVGCKLNGKMLPRMHKDLRSIRSRLFPLPLPTHPNGHSEAHLQTPESLRQEGGVWGWAIQQDFVLKIERSHEETGACRLVPFIRWGCWWRLKRHCITWKFVTGRKLGD